jgi:hypothetical protein
LYSYYSSRSIHLLEDLLLAADEEAMLPVAEEMARIVDSSYLSSDGDFLTCTRSLDGSTVKLAPIFIESLAAIIVKTSSSSDRFHRQQQRVLQSCYARDCDRNENQMMICSPLDRCCLGRPGMALAILAQNHHYANLAVPGSKRKLDDEKDSMLKTIRQQVLALCSRYTCFARSSILALMLIMFLL